MALTLVQPIMEAPEDEPGLPGNAQALRAALADAITSRREADERADAAKDTARRAEQARADARRYVDSFHAAHAAKATELREAHVKAISEAIRQDKPVPGTPASRPRPRHGRPTGRREPARRLASRSARGRQRGR